MDVTVTPVTPAVGVEVEGISAANSSTEASPTNVWRFSRSTALSSTGTVRKLRASTWSNVASSISALATSSAIVVRSSDIAGRSFSIEGGKRCRRNSSERSTNDTRIENSP